MDVIQFATEVLIDGTAVAIAGEPSISADIDTFGTVVEFQLLSRPVTFPAEDTPVQINRVNLTTAEYIPLFGGYIGGGTDVESEPWNLQFRALDELSKFSALRTTNDLNLTGMTDGEAWEAIAGVCDVDFDPADIVDTGYVLGERLPVWWKVDTTGQSIIEELDRVFQCKTMAVGNNRVIRFVYDRVADTSDITTTYTKADSNDFLANHLNRGDKGQVQSLWVVQGVTVDCGPEDACSCMVWAQSVGTTPRRGKKISRTPKSQFPQSDLIQDETLAQAISRRMMRWYNRIPKTYAITGVTDANMYPGRVIGVVDLTYGMDATSTVAAFVTSVEKAGSTMTLTAVGGPGGSTGTTTSGVEQRCNETNTDNDWTGDWTPPDFDFPPIDVFVPWLGDLDFGLPVFGGTEASLCTSLLGASWVNDNTVWGPAEAGSYTFPGNIVGTVNPVEGPFTEWGIEMFGDAGVAADENWIVHIAGTHTLNAGMIALYLIDDSQEVSLQIGATGVSESSNFSTDSDSAVPGATLDTGAFEFTLEKTGDGFEATYTGDGGVVLYNGTLDSLNWDANSSGANLQLGIVSWTEGTGGSVLLTTIEVCPGAEEEDYLVGVPVPAIWENDANPPGEDFIITGSTITGPSEANSVGFTTNPLLPERSAGVPKNYKVEFDLHVNSTDGNVEVFGEDATTFAFHWWLSYFNTPTGRFFMAGCWYEGLCTVAEFDFGALTPGATIAVVVEWDADTTSYTVTVDGVTEVISAAGTGIDNPIRFGAIGNNDTGGTCTVSDFEITVLE